MIIPTALNSNPYFFRSRVADVHDSHYFEMSIFKAAGITRRAALTGTMIGAAMLPYLSTQVRAASPERILFVHGRAQGGRDPEDIRAEWLAAFQDGLNGTEFEIPDITTIALPFYGDTLEELTARSRLPTASRINSKGDAAQDEFLIFQEEVANDIREAAGITDDQVDAIYGDNPREKGPLNWEWVQALIASIDRNATGLSQGALEVFLRDVFLYISSSGVRRIIDDIVSEELDVRPTVVVGHSLGSVVSYNILTSGTSHNVPLFVTLGSPLGIRAIRRRFRPLRFPDGVGAWVNAYDPRDVVALHPLDQENFAVIPAIENIGDIENQTENRHGISGYLNKSNVAGRIATGA